MAKKTDALLNVLSSLDKRMKKSGGSFMTAEEIEREYAVQAYISTGLPSLDLHLMTDGEGNYGIPTGRITEIHGKESSGKSLLCNALLARVRANGGLCVKMTSEMDIDLDWEYKFYRKEGLDIENDVLPYVRWNPVVNIGQLTLATQTWLSTIREHQEAGDFEQFPSSIIVVDSIAAMMGDDDHKRFNEAYVMSGKERKERIGEDGVVEQPKNKMGDHSKGLHMFFKGALQDIAKYNVAMVITNQLRANMSGGYGAPADKPAHDWAIKYNASLRIRIDRWGANESSVTREGIEFKRGYNVYAYVKKIRGEEVQKGRVELLFRPGSGFDYWYSLIDAFHMSGFAKVRAGKYRFQLDLDVPYKDELQFLLEEMEGKKKEELKPLLRDNPEAAAMLEAIVYHLGPVRVNEDGDLIEKNIERGLNENPSNL